MSSSGHRHDLAEEASKEMNGAKLTLMIAQLCEAIDAEREGKPRPIVTDLHFPLRDPPVRVEN
jgi:hypothetical protein